MSATPENKQSHEPTRHETLRTELPPWYFVCERCNAKWFAKQELMDCPRCSSTLRSAVRLTPPWLPQGEQSRNEVEDTRVRAGRRGDARSTGADEVTREPDI